MSTNESAAAIPPRSTARTIASVKDFMAARGHDEATAEQEARQYSAFEWERDLVWLNEQRVAGLVSTEQFERLREAFRRRNQLVWGSASHTPSDG